jgi:hypothetical protein
MRRYRKNTVLNFGKFKGYEIGIVYVFSPAYIEWAIDNIEDFCIVDLDELMQYSVIDETPGWIYTDASLIPNIDVFDTFKELIENVDLGSEKYEFSEDTLAKNREKCVGI